MAACKIGNHHALCMIASPFCPYFVINFTGERHKQGIRGNDPEGRTALIIFEVSLAFNRSF
jgi:hypothetical protein